MSTSINNCMSCLYLPRVYDDCSSDNCTLACVALNVECLDHLLPSYDVYGYNGIFNLIGYLQLHHSDTIWVFFHV